MGNIGRVQCIKTEQIPNIARVDYNPTLLHEYKQQASAAAS